MAAANAVTEAQCSPDLLKKLGDEGEDKPELTKLSTQQRQELLLTALERDRRLALSGYHADTPITIKAEPFIWPTAALINIHEHPI